jgi:hypothetical protein
MILRRAARLALLSALGFQLATSFAFEGRVTASLTQGGQVSGLLYTAGKDYLRIEQTNTDWPHARNIVNLQSGELTLLFPHNRSFVRLKSAAQSVTAPTPSAPAMPVPPGGLPPGIGPQSVAARSAPMMPAMPMMPAPPVERAELKGTGERTNILGLACVRYELKQRGETLEVWATDKLFAFEPYRQNQPHRFGPRTIEEQWPEQLTARKLFPLVASLRFDNGAERFRFEVKSITPEKIEDSDAKLFQPPPDYQEIQPLPF